MVQGRLPGGGGIELGRQDREMRPFGEESMGRRSKLPWVQMVGCVQKLRERVLWLERKAGTKESFRCQAGGPGPPPEGSAEPWKRVKDMVSQIYIDREGVGSQGRGNQQVWGYSLLHGLLQRKVRLRKAPSRSVNLTPTVENGAWTRRL